MGEAVEAAAAGGQEEHAETGEVWEQRAESSE